VGKEVERMSLSIMRRVLVGAVVVAFVLSALVLTVPRVQAATWTQDTAVDFGQDTLSGLEIIGSGSPAYLQILKDSTDWKEESPSSDPGAREGPAMAYDSANDVVVLFGGYNSLNFNDTWEYTPGSNTWNQVSPPTAPSSRAYAGMAYDSAQNRIVLFGGVSDSDYEADTWEYNAAANTWQQTTPVTSPPKMTTYHLTFYQTQGRVLLEGQNLLTSSMETWAYNAATDLWTNRGPTAQPSSRSSPALSYNGDLDCAVLFGGFDASVPPGTILGDTWEYCWSMNTWTQTANAGPAPRTSPGMSYRSSTPATYLFGGKDATTYYTDTWRYPDFFGNHQWEYVMTQRNPVGRAVFGFADETPAKKSFFFGGRTSGGLPTSDTWSLGPVYRLYGTVVSTMLDSGGANVDWNTISWVGTSSPPTTVLRYQLATSNDPAGPWDYVGPGGSISAYYTTSPTAIWTGHDGQRYLRYFAQIYTQDDLVSPTLDSLTIDYTVAASNPYIILTDPYNLQTTVPTDKLISIRFSEPMIPGSLAYTIVPSLTTTKEWSEGNSKLTINHTEMMQQCKSYAVTITAGTDVDGNSLIPGPKPNPWSFTTICVPPEITSTTPMQGAVDVPLNTDIVVTFTEPMNRTSVVPTITPSLSVTPTWSNGDKTVTYGHATDFTQCLDYTVEIAGKDVDGQSLIPGMAPNPWSFRVECTIPYVVSTVPIHMQIDVGLSQDIVVTFSKPMNTATVVANMNPVVTLNPTWSNGDKTVTYSHAPFQTCTGYTVTMTGKDAVGTDLWLGRFDGFAENPWTFATTCSNPFIVFTVPPDGATDVNQLADIVVQFSKAMNNSTVTYDLQPSVPLTAMWDVDNKVLFLNHTQRFTCGVHQMTITGRDTGGNSLVTVLAPNPWTFTPFCPNPYVVSTDPANNTFGVPLDKEVVVTFNEPMDPLSLVHSLTPPDVTMTPSWSVGNTVVTFTHTVPFNSDQEYRFFVDGADETGNGLMPASIPNPWWFTTVGASPYIDSTEPADGDTSVPLTQDIIITFSEQMNTGMTSCTVSPPGVTMIPVWSSGDTVLTLNHAAPFAELTIYTVTCAGQDIGGNVLVDGPVPNPWSFTTAQFEPPEILLTDPQDGAIDVPLTQNVVVTFSEPMDTVTVSCTLSPPGVTLSASWTVGNTVLTLSHATPFTVSTTYTVTCQGKDMDGNDLVAGSVPNPWSFTTVGVQPPEAPGGLQAAKVPPSIVRLTWRAVTGADSYRIYESSNRFAAFPWTILGETSATTYDANHLADGQTHFYIVRTVKGGIESANSTMAVKIERSIGYSPTGANIYWFSLPYHSSYLRASDISTELTSTKISVVAKWNPAAQKPVIWYYLRNKWHGTDFTISPGEGIYIGSVSAFSWAIVGTDASVILSFTYNSPPKNNINLISVPYTGTYSRASDIANELTPSKVTEIGMWDPVTQTMLNWRWTGSAWTGTDFTFNPGDGIYIMIASSFNWQPILITPEVA
jgi:hypothetical protein